MDNHRRLANARLRANARLSLMIHLAVYVVVNALLIVINLLTSTEYLWFWWPLLGWGIGLALHALAIVLIPKLLGKRQRMIDDELQKSH